MTFLSLWHLIAQHLEVVSSLGDIHMNLVERNRCFWSLAVQWSLWRTEQVQLPSIAHGDCFTQPASLIYQRYSKVRFSLVFLAQPEWMELQRSCQRRFARHGMANFWKCKRLRNVAEGSVTTVVQHPGICYSCTIFLIIYGCFRK